MNIFPVFLSFRRTYHRAAFRRVAGGVLPVRWRGVEEINHGRTRTPLTNARPELEMRKRKRRASVLVCGLSQRFE